MIIPAIDIYNGQCVRLAQGKFNQVTNYGDPQSIIVRYQQAGFTRCHLVDLNGAQTGDSQFKVIRDLCQVTDMTLQVGGGIRHAEQIEQLLDLGVSQIVLGSLIEDVDKTQKLLDRYGAEQFILALDVDIMDNIPRLVTNGWQTVSAKSLWDIIDIYQNQNIFAYLCTDIRRDGMLSGPNFDLYQSLMQRYPKLIFQASGGVATASDITCLKQAGLPYAIVGKALLENNIPWEAR